MKDASHVQWARRLIDDQLERLSELRNANPRDPGFKLWRQTTLTIIQRIWPGDLARCERFRRVPFSSTSPRPSRAQIRENYERGCAEASSYLKILTLELETQGLGKSGAAHPEPRPAKLPEDLVGSVAPPPADPREMFEPSPLDRIQAPAPVSQPAPAAPPAPAPEPPAPAPPAPPVQAIQPPPAKAAQPPPERPAAPPPQKSRRPGRQGLKEMLGFGDDGSRTQTDGPASFGSPAPPPAFAGGREREDVLDPRLEAMLAEAEETAFVSEVTPSTPAPAKGTQEVAPPPVEETQEIVNAPESAFETPPMPEPEVRAGDLPIEFLGSKKATAGMAAPAKAAPAKAAPAKAAPPPPPPPPPPVAPKPPAPVVSAPVAPAPAPPAPVPPAQARPQTVVATAAKAAPAPVARAAEPVLPGWANPQSASPSHAPNPSPTPPQAQAPPAPASPFATSPTSAALMAIAGQVERLGVPEGQCAAASAALIDLARQLDEKIASFDSIREILWIVADYPALARRTIPLLIPHLDLE